MTEHIRWDDVTQSVLERWLCRHQTEYVVCVICGDCLIPHIDGGWLHWEEVHRPPREDGLECHQPFALWTTRDPPTSFGPATRAIV